MTTILINDKSFELFAFNRRTTYNEEKASTIDITINSNNNDELFAIDTNLITVLKIIKDNEIVFDIGEMTGKLNTISEIFDGEKIKTDVTIQLNT